MRQVVGKRRLVQCPTCGNERLVTRDSGRECRFCAQSRKRSLRAVELSTYDLVDMFFRSTVSRNPVSKALVLRRYSRHELVAALGATGLSEEDALDPSSFKLALRQTILNRTDRPFDILSYVLDRHLTLSPRVQSSGNVTAYNICDSRGLVSELLKRLGFDFVEVRASSSVNVRKGSFFINGKWIHIG